jgi:putative hydrolase of the HAD superfamily
MMKYEVLLFDLFGVLVGISKATTDLVLGWTKMSEKELWNAWLRSPTVRDYDLGQLSTRDFAERFVREWKLPVEPAEFLEVFSVWSAGFYEGAEILLTKLARDHRLACFSNNNELLWFQIRDEFGLGRLVDECYVSYQMGLMKPDPEAYRYVIRQLNCKPERIAFFDDSETNVQVAEQFGMDAFVTKGLGELQIKLKELDIM